jgi:hypothetical protein
MSQVTNETGSTPRDVNKWSTPNKEDKPTGTETPQSITTTFIAEPTQTFISHLNSNTTKTA